MNIYRVAFITTLSLVVAACFATGYQITEAGPIIKRMVDVVPGWRWAELGWLGPMEFCFAWFANIPLLINVVRMAAGRSPAKRAAWIAMCLALSVLLPQIIFQPADGWHIGYLRGTSVWLWLSTFVIGVFASYAPERRSVMDIETFL